MRVILSNLLTNALKYSKDSLKPIEVEVGISNGKPFLKITDFGVGIPASEMEKIFQPFYRVDASRSKKFEGFGLGLFIAKNIVDAHGWTLTVSSSPELGTSFYIKS